MHDRFFVQSKGPAFKINFIPDNFQVFALNMVDGDNKILILSTVLNLSSAAFTALK